MNGAAYDVSKLRIVGGVIRYKIRQQDGSFQEMALPDSQHNRLFVQWVQIHDGAAGAAAVAA